jgi:hypothetical protein
MTKSIPITVNAIVEDYDSGKFLWCDCACPLFDDSGDHLICKLEDNYAILGFDNRGELRTPKCLEAGK